MILKSLIALWTVIAISVAAYISFLAEDMYTSESYFTVVVDDSDGVDLSSGLLNIMGQTNKGNTDTQTVIGFIQSADLLLDLERKFQLDEHYSSPKNDFIFNLNKNATVEDRIKYYRNHITAEFSTTSGHVILNIETYSKDLSFEISKYILSRTEKFINELNQSIAKKRMSFVIDELNRTEENIKKREKLLLNFQNINQIIEPDEVIKSQLRAIQALRIENFHKKVDLITVKSESPNSPLIKSLETTIAQIDDEISSQEKALAGPEQQKLNQLSAEYKNLVLDLEFAVKLHEGAQVLLEKTRADELQHTRFFSVIQTPSLPDGHSSPRRLYLILTAFAVCFLCYYISVALLKSFIER
jgi:capsular polysaccharide transport system permease protein